MDKGIRLQKEIAMGIASKAEKTRDPNVKVQNKACGGKVKKAPMKGTKK